MLPIKYTICLLNLFFALHLQNPLIVSIESVLLWCVYAAEIPLASKAQILIFFSFIDN